MGIIEINGNLVDEKNYEVFKKIINEVLNIFIKTFGKSTMKKYDLFIDNATRSSGYTPCITVLLEKHLTIKLGIEDFSNREQIAYQLSHELCHYVFYTLKGLDREKADVKEENICSAMSLVIINLLFPEKINKWIRHVNNLEDKNYNNGVVIAIECNFDINILKNKIFEVCKIIYK